MTTEQAPDDIIDLFSVVARNVSAGNACGRWIGRWDDIEPHTSELAEAYYDELLRLQASRFGAVSDAFKAEVSQRIGGLSPKDGRSQLRLLAVLELIDGLFNGLNVAAPSDGFIHLAYARDRLRRLGTLTTSMETFGHVLPRAMVGERGKTIFDFLGSLVPVEVANTVSLKYLLVEEPRMRRPEGKLRVGVVAVVQHESELDWKFDDQGKNYEVRLSPSGAEAAERRVLAGLDWLEKKKADLVLLPELVSSGELVNLISEKLRSMQDGFPPFAVLGGSYLQSTTGGLRNLAPLLSGTGEVLVSQAKLNPYTLTPAHRAGVTLPGADSKIKYVENIECCPWDAYVTDISGIGRVVIAICEDLARLQPWRPLAKAVGPHLCLSPVMNGPAKSEWNWVAAGAEEIANEAGAAVVAVNSGALMGKHARSSEAYALGRFPASEGCFGSWLELETADPERDVDGDGIEDVWLYELTHWPMGGASFS